MTSLTRVLAASSALLAIGAALPAQGRVHTVDDGNPDADFTNLQEAVDAAANGDTLLVSSGDYGIATVSSKSLTIVGQIAGTVRVELRVEGLAASQTVGLMRLVTSTMLWSPAITLADNAGLVWIDECTADGWGEPALRASNCDRVVLVRSSFESHSDGFFGILPVGPAAVELTGSSTLHAYDCTLRGAHGAAYWESWNQTFFVQRGSPGLVSPADSFLFLSRCTVDGGHGTYSVSPWTGWSTCSDGGPGLANAGEAIVLDSVLIGGAGGMNGSHQCGHDGADATGAVQVLAGEGLSLTMSQLGREREDVTFTFQGPPFRPVYLGGSPMAHATFLPALRGSLLVGVPRAMKFMGFTDGTGRLEVVHSIGLLPPSSDIRRVYLQPFYLGGATLGAGALYVILDERF